MIGITRRFAQTGLLAVMASICISAIAADEAYPTKPITLVIPFGPGGASDFVARVIQPRLSENLGQQVVIVNRAGAAGNIGVTSVAQSKGDGYTLLLGNIGTMTINPSVYGDRLRINTIKDFAPVSLVADAPDILIASPSFGPNSVKEFVDHVRANPGKVDFASPGAGSVNRLEMELLVSAAGLKMVHVPFKGGAGEAVASLLGAQVPVMFTSMASASAHVQGKTLKALAVTSSQRTSNLPHVPTMAEQGYPDLVASSWQALYAPAGTPAAIVTKLYEALKKTMADPDIAARLNKAGMDVRVSGSPAELGTFTESELKRWTTVVKASGVSAD